MSIILSKGRTVFVSDTNVTEMPAADDLADIATQGGTHGPPVRFHAARGVRCLFDVRLSMGARSEHVRAAVRLLDQRQPDFEYEGEMAANIALRTDAKKTYPFIRLSAPANVLIMPAIHSASISTKLLAELGECTVLGPILIGFRSRLQIAGLGASATDIGIMAAMAAFDPERLSAPPASGLAGERLAQCTD